MPIERDLACTCRCGAKASIRAGLSWVLEDHADVLSRNAFHRFTCAACGANVSVELDFLVTNRARDRFLQVVVADAAVAEARADLARLAPGAWARIVPNRLALVEKVRLLLAREDDVAIEVAKFLRRVSLGDREGRYALHWDRVEGDGHVFAVFERGQPLGTVGVPREVVDRIVKEHDTKRFDRELEVDERLARKILDEDRRAKAAAPPAAAPPAAAPPAAAPPSAAPPGAPASSAPANAAKPDEERLGHGYVELAVAAEYVRAERGASDAIVCVGQQVSITVDAETGAMSPSVGRPAKPGRPSVLRGDVIGPISFEETAAGPFTTVTIDGAPIRLFGEPRDGARAGALVVLVLHAPGHGLVAVPWIAGTRPALAIPLVRPLLDHDADGVAILDAACAYFLRAVGAELSVSALPSRPAEALVASLAAANPDEPPLPRGTTRDVALTRERLAILEGNVLALYDRKTLAVRPGFGLVTAEADALHGPPSPHPIPAKVVFLGERTVAVDHPTLRRLQLVRPKGLFAAKGDPVFLDDVRETLPGIARVFAYHLGESAGLAASAVRAFAESKPRLTLRAPTPPRPARPPAGAPTGAELDAWSRGQRTLRLALSIVSARLRVRVSPLLGAIVERSAKDPIFARWLDALGLTLDPGWDLEAALRASGRLEEPGRGRAKTQSLVGDWDADPHLFVLIDVGDGDAYALYLYPPWCESGREPVVVRFLHETNRVDFEALTFGAFFESRLRAATLRSAASARIVELVRAALALPETDAIRGDAPDFLPLDGLPLPRGGDPGDPRLVEERRLLDRYLDQDESAVPELLRLYRDLGWAHAEIELTPSR